MKPRIRNRPLAPQTPIDRARKVAKAALQGWYNIGVRKADKIIPKLQQDYNLETVSSIPGWQQQKGSMNGYVMITTLFGTPRPIVLKLKCGTLTYRQLHHQIRECLELEKKVSLRLCPYRPWYRHNTKTSPIPEASALPASDAKCSHLLGTTLLYYCYVHLTGGEENCSDCQRASYRGRTELPLPWWCVPCYLRFDCCCTWEFWRNFRELTVMWSGLCSVSYVAVYPVIW